MSIACNIFFIRDHSMVKALFNNAARIWKCYQMGEGTKNHLAPIKSRPECAQALWRVCVWINTTWLLSTGAGCDLSGPWLEKQHSKKRSVSGTSPKESTADRFACLGMALMCIPRWKIPGVALVSHIPNLWWWWPRSLRLSVSNFQTVHSTVLFTASS